MKDDEHCTAFHRQVCRALQREGIFITPPPQWRPRHAPDLELQRLLFREVVTARWNCVRDESLTRRQLAAAGFEVLTVRYDAQAMFPTVVARKR